MIEKEIQDKIDNKICLRCGKPIDNDRKLFCKECYKEGNEKIKNGKLSNSWEEILWLCVIAQMLGYNPNDKDNEND